MLTKRLIKVGGSHALIIDKPIMELLGLTAETELELTTDGRALKVTPKVRRATREEFLAAKKQVFTDHRKTLAKLAK
jgi:antitoxin component of MazEF toxin-antitoxin module